MKRGVRIRCFKDMKIDIPMNIHGVQANWRSPCRLDMGGKGKGVERPSGSL